MELVLQGVSLLENNVEFKVLDQINNIKSRLPEDKYYELNITMNINSPILYQSSIFSSDKSFENENRRLAYCYNDVGGFDTPMHKYNDDVLIKIVEAIYIQIQRVKKILAANGYKIILIKRKIDKSDSKNYIILTLEDWDTAKYKKLFFAKVFDDICISDHCFSNIISQYFLDNKILFRRDANYELKVFYSYYKNGDMELIEQKLKENVQQIRKSINSLKINFHEILVFGCEVEKQPELRIVICQKEFAKPNNEYIMPDCKIAEKLTKTYCYLLLENKVESFRKTMKTDWFSTNGITYESLIKRRDMYKIDDFADEELKNKYKWAVQLIELDHKKYLIDRRIPIIEGFDEEFGSWNSYFEDDDIYRKVKLFLKDL